MGLPSFFFFCFRKLLFIYLFIYLFIFPSLPTGQVPLLRQHLPGRVCRQGVQDVRGSRDRQGRRRPDHQPISAINLCCLFCLLVLLINFPRMFFFFWLWLVFFFFPIFLVSLCCFVKKQIVSYPPPNFPLVFFLLLLLLKTYEKNYILKRKRTRSE